MYYLHHYFDPDFSHVRLTPPEGADGAVDPHYLGYVQNVVAGQVLAEIVDLEQFPDTRRDPRFLYRERRLPIGPNCAPHRENPDRIVATSNGYVFYHDGLISVKKMLNVRGNVGFHTGNIMFVGDLAVHGDVLTNFAVHARNVLVKATSKAPRSRPWKTWSACPGSREPTPAPWTTRLSKAPIWTARFPAPCLKPAETCACLFASTCRSGPRGT